ncbi:hypothetical protein CU098_009710, partial [Rhizopus stolonifer]
ISSGFTAVVEKSTKSCAVFVCSRGGSPRRRKRDTNTKEVRKRKLRRSYRIGCPWRLDASYIHQRNLWLVVDVKNSHKHALFPSLESDMNEEKESESYFEDDEKEMKKDEINEADIVCIEQSKKGDKMNRNKESQSVSPAPVYTKSLGNIYGLPENCIVGVHNVQADEHCGFRCLALAIHGNEELYMKVRREMIVALRLLKLTYMIQDMPYDVDRVEKVLDAPATPVGTEHYFLALECAQLASEIYIRPVIILSRESCQLYVPLLSSPSVNSYKNMIILRLENSHFNLVKAKSESGGFLKKSPVIINPWHDSMLCIINKKQDHPTRKFFNKNWDIIFPNCFK